MYNKDIRAITLLEIMVSIVVLVILAGISYISFDSYIINARDGTRIFEFENIQSSLNSYNLKKGHYPEPSDSVDVTYLGEKVWSQGTFGNSIAEFIGYTEDVKDPLTGTPYTYSLKNSKKAFALAGVLEAKLDHVAINGLNSEVNAASSAGTREGTAMVLGNYNGEITSTMVDGLSHILAIPTIVASNLSSTILTDIVDNNRLVVHGYGNLPASYSGTVFNVDANIDYLLGDLSLYVGNVSNFSLGYLQIELLRNMYSAYSGSILGNDISVNRLNYDELYEVVYSNEMQGIACDTINEKLKFYTECDPIDIMTLYILNMLIIDLNNLPGNLENAFVDSNGNYVIGTSGGFVIYDGETWTTFNAQETDLIHNNIYAIIEDLLGYYWIGTNSGISRYNADAVDPDPIWITYVDQLVNKSIRVLYNDHDGVEPDIVRIGTAGGVHRYDIYEDPEPDPFHFVDNLSSNSIYAILVDSNGLKWFGTDTKGVDKYDSDSGIIVNYDDNSGLPNKVVNYLFEDMNNRIWVGTNGGLGVTSDSGDTWSSITEQSGLVDDAITYIFDNTHSGIYSIWFGTANGLSRYSNGVWTTYNTSQALEHRLEGDEVVSIYFDVSGAIAVLTDGSLTTIHPSTGEVIYPAE